MDALFLVFCLMVAFQIKHFVCDFPLQNGYMLGKFKGGFEWVGPLSAHASVHAIGTLLICCPFFGWGSIVPALADFAVHFIVDRIKASPTLGGRFKPSEKLFWWCLGADQMAHHLTHYAIIAWVVYTP